MRLSILLLIIGVCIVMGEPINVAIPAAVPSSQLVTSSFPTAPIVETPAASSLHDQLPFATSLLDKPILDEPIVEGAKPTDVKDDETKVPVHLMPIKLDLEEGTGIENPTLDVDADNNDVSHEGEGLVDIGGDVNLDITILAGLEADAANTAAGELTSFDGASEEEIKSIVEGVVDEQDLDAFDGISDSDIDVDGDTMIEEQGKEEDEKDKAEHEKEEKKEEEEKANKGEGDKEKDKDVLGKEIEVESGIKVENPINHGEVTVNYVENLNLNLRGRHHKFRGLHHLARKLRLMKRIIKWFSKPVHHRLSLLRFHKFHKLRALELKLRLLKLKLLTDAIKMLRLARVVTMMKIKGDLTKLALGRVIMHKVRQPFPEDVKTDEEKTNLANRLARIRAFKNLLRARRLARFRTMMTSPIRSRRAFHSRAFTTSPIVSSWHRPQFMTSPIVASPWSHPSLSQFVTQPIISSPNPYHLLALRGVDDGTELNHPVVHPVEEEEDDSMNEGVYEDLIRQQHPLLSPTSHFDTQPIISEPLLQHSNMMLFGESEPSEHEETDETGYEHPMMME